ncbi:MAG: T9SS type A sorting domain-containing protein [Bacteroidota bacterium]
MKKSIFLLLGFIVFLGGLKAQEGPRKKRKEAREAVQAYVEINVLPVVSEQRAKLDVYLTADERETVDEIRTELLALREEMKAKKKEKRAQFKETGERPEPTEEEKAEMKAAAKARRLLMTQAWEIADTYEAEIESLLAEIEPQKEIWKEGVRSIMEDFRPEGKPERVRPGHGGERPERMEEPRGRRGFGRRGPGGPGGMMDIFQQPVKFLLFDEDMLEKVEFEEDEGVMIFPNPTLNQNQLSYEVKETGRVSIQLLDQQGNVLQTVLSTYQDAGNYEQQIDLSELQPGVYLYQIQTPTGTSTKKVIKQ